MTNHRRDSDSDSKVVEKLDFMCRAGGITLGGWFSRLVVTDYFYVDYERRLRERVDPKTKKLPWTKRKVKPHLVEEYRRHCAKLTAKRWEDTGRRLRGAMLIFATNGDWDRRRSFTLWIGKELIEQARSSGKPLAKIMRDRLADRLRGHLGAKQFGFWFHIERTRTDPYGLHVQGIITVKDPSHLVGAANKRLREQIIAASGEYHSVPPARILDMHKADLNIGWISYSRKQKRFSRIKPLPHRVLPTDIGEKVDAWSGTLNRDAKTFYERARIVYNAIIRGEVKDWTDADWDKVSDPNEV
jgi:hypothetical protein